VGNYNRRTLCCNRSSDVSLIFGTLRYGDYGLRTTVGRARFSLAETLGRVHNEWRENAK